MSGDERTAAASAGHGSRRTVAGRLLISYLVVLVAFAVTLGWSLRALSAAARDAQLVRAAYAPLLTSIGEALAGQNVMNTQLNHVTSAKNPDDVRQWIETARRLRPLTLRKIRDDAVDGLPSDLDGTGLRAHVVAETHELDQRLADEEGRFMKLFQAIELADSARAERLRDELVARETEGAKRLRLLRQRVAREMDALAVDASEREQRSILLLIGLGVLTLAVGLLSSIYARRVLAPLSVVTARARAVAAGDLTPRDVLPTGDELGELATTFEGMVAAIRKARAELVQAERLAAIGKMAAHITHEVRNPLSSIGLNLELLEEEMGVDDADQEATQLVCAIRSEVERLSQIAEQYLSAAREPQLHVQLENVEDLVRDCHAFMRLELERAELESSVQIEADLPELQLDEAQLRQALINLLRNAREASPKGGEVRLTLAREGEDAVAIRVEDRGSGVPEELRTSIFDPFYTTKQRGTGLGLAVTRAIVEAHGGTIACEPRAGGGTSFVIRLPVAGIVPEDTAPPGA